MALWNVAAMLCVTGMISGGPADPSGKLAEVKAGKRQQAQAS